MSKRVVRASCLSCVRYESVRPRLRFPRLSGYYREANQTEWVGVATRACASTGSRVQQRVQNAVQRARSEDGPRMWLRLQWRQTCGQEARAERAARYSLLHRDFCPDFCRVSRYWTGAEGSRRESRVANVLLTGTGRDQQGANGSGIR